MAALLPGLRACCCALALTGLVIAPLAGEVMAKSALSPRHSGLEPPGGPRRLEAMPGNMPSRTPEGGMGYTDAYGNALEDRQPEEKAPRKRPRAGAYGTYGSQGDNRPLPDPDSGKGPALWNFR